jgi:hypothetical protein
MEIHTRISDGLALVANLFTLAGAVVFSTPNVANAGSIATPVPVSRPSGAAGPVAGAGLPVLAVGYCVYWLIKRHRRKAAAFGIANRPFSRGS